MEKKPLKKVILVMFFISITILFLSLQNVSAANLRVTKTAKHTIVIGEVLEVKIVITNLENYEIPVSVKEHITNADPVDPPNFYEREKCPYTFCIEPDYYMWNVTLPSNSTYTITYKIKPLSFGNFVIPPTEVKTLSGETFYSDSLAIIVQCKSNGKCESNLGENYFTCPEDCPSGSADNVCDLIKDGKCDPDCEPGTDPDCLAPTTTTLPPSPLTQPALPFYYIAIIFIFIAVILFFLLTRIRVQRGESPS
jgi:hypothetical protein